ncbi:hypothetical protein PaeCFBP13512_03885 [Paenibacillus sp. CFBP13512]|uniref:hypothetical protein n=1 Tax=Paenibacillus sp. CFBP13512 TaxID=2184007 RepID=UPI0010C10F0F|nr:hypothetical protein [Paenibacillus sp. CFBP13512]TKJ93537.1 hypothetical protein PaeCFBP13512_03885 [Paenibacillus sp. CFBP13512]
MLLNIKVIGLTLITMALGFFIFNIIFDKVIIRSTEYLGKRLAKKTKSKFSLILIELTSFLSILLYPITLIIFLIRLDFDTRGFSEIFLITTLSFLLIFFLLSSTLIEARKLYISHNFFVTNFCRNLNTSINKKYFEGSYLQNIINLILKQAKDLYVISLIGYLTLIFLTHLNWGINIFFVGLLLIPSYGVYWVYYTNFFVFNIEKRHVFIRRVIGYFIVGFLSIYIVHSEYISMIFENNQALYLFIIFVIWSNTFILLDRILKEIHSDYLNFKNNSN